MKQKILLTLLIGLLFTSCTSTDRYHKVVLQGEAQGTYYAITYYDSLNRNFQPQIDSLFNNIEYSMSLWMDTSIINRVNQGDTSMRVDAIFQVIYKAARAIAEKTDGDFDYTVGPLTAAWGFGAKDTLEMDPSKVDSLMQFVGYKKVRLEGNRVVKDNPKLQFDFNAIAKGFTCDYMGRFLKMHNVHNFLVDIGGETLANGEKPDRSTWKVGIQDPTVPKEFKSYRVIMLKNQGLATSGNYRNHHEQGGENVVHTIDPHTGYPKQDSLLSATILAKNTMTADGYATACMVMGLKKSINFIEKEPDLSAFFIYQTHDGKLKTYYTKGMEAAFVKTDS